LEVYKGKIVRPKIPNIDNMKLPSKIDPDIESCLRGLIGYNCLLPGLKEKIFDEGLEEVNII